MQISVKEFAHSSPSIKISFHPNAINHHTATAFLAVPHNHGISGRQPGLMAMERRKMEGETEESEAKEGAEGEKHRRSHFGNLKAR